jgi:hypothetical protein
MIEQLGVGRDSTQMHRESASLTVDDLGHNVIRCRQDAVGKFDL